MRETIDYTSNDTPITFEELYRLLQERNRYICQKENVEANIRKLKSDLVTAETNLKLSNDSIKIVEAKFTKLTKELARLKDAAD